MGRFSAKFSNNNGTETEIKKKLQKIFSVYLVKVDN